MKYGNTLNLFWMIMWAVVLIGAIVAIFWKPALCVVVVVAAVMFGMFLHDFIHFARLK